MRDLWFQVKPMVLALAGVSAMVLGTIWAVSSGR